jgi:adenylylsulfate kinase-like enzyme
MTTALPVLWLYGPSGVGKTTVAWEVYRRLAAEGAPVGYVDIDQIGMNYGPPTAENWAPEPASDPVRYRLKAANLDAVAANYAAIGARCLVVPGILDPERGVDAARLPNTALTLCRLRADEPELMRRLHKRGNTDEPVDEILRDARELERGTLPGVHVETTGLGVAEVADQVLKLTDGWPGPVAQRSGASAAEAPGAALARTDAPGEVLLLCGPTGVGKSTVGWSAYRATRLAGHQSSYVDLDQISFLEPQQGSDPGRHRLKAANLAAVWHNFHARGASHLVAVGPIETDEAVRAYAEALPAARITVCRLHAGPESFAERITLRGEGRTPPRGLAGDLLAGRPAAELRRIADQAAAESTALDRAGVGEVRLPTDGRTPADLAEELLRGARWV